MARLRCRAVDEQGVWPLVMLARNSLFAIAASIFPVLVTISTLPFLLSLIGAERYGALTLCWLILIYSAHILDGVGTAITHAVARAASDEQAARDTMVTGLATSLVLSPATAMVACMIAFIFFDQFFAVSEVVRGELIASIWLIGASSFVSGVSRSVYGALVGKERFPTASLALMVSNGGLPLLALIFAHFFGADMVVLLWASLTAYSLGLAVLLLDLWRSQLRGKGAKLSMARSKALLQFGFWIMATAIVAPLLLTMDRMVIGAQLGAIAVAAYTIPFQVISRLQLIPQSLVKVLFPRLSVSQGDTAKRMAFFYSILMSACFAPLIVGLIFLMEPLLELWLGDNLDARSVHIGTWLLCAFYVTAIVQTMAVFLQSQERGDLVAKFQMATILPYLALLLYCAETYGLMGVVGAFLLRRTIEAFFLVAKSRFGNRSFWITQIPAVLGLGAAIALTSLVPQLAMKLLAGSIIASIVLAGAVACAPAELRAMVLSQGRKLLRL
jgi:O-antigen/teichoic acid export membrane protein